MAASDTSVERIQGTLGSSNTAFARQILRAGTHYKLATNDDVVNVDATDVQLTLPDSPYVGEKHLVIAVDGNCVVKGGANELIGGDVLVDHGQSGSFAFSTSKKWVQTASSPETAKDYLTQNVWYINPTTGNNNKKGNTPSTALKTFAEWAQRVGMTAGTIPTLNPVGGTLMINIMGDLPQTDPVTFKAIMAAGCTAKITGQKKVLSTGSISVVQGKNAALNQPYEITKSSGAAAYWTPFLGKAVFTSSGAVAYVCRDMGAKTAHMSEWMDASFVDADGFVFPGPAPAINDTFEVVDYTQVYLGTMIVGYNPEVAIQGGPPVGGLLCTQLHAMGTDAFEPSFPTSFGTPEAISAFSNCILETPMVQGVSYSNSGNNCYLNGLRMFSGAQLVLLGGAFLPAILNTAGYPGGIRVENGAELLTDGDPTFVGDINGSGQSADVQIIGVTSLGPMSFWNTTHGIFPAVSGGRLHWESFTGFYGTYGYVPLWGTGNAGLMIYFSNSSALLEQYNESADCPLPSIEMGNGPGVVPVFDLGAGEDIGQSAFVWDAPTATFLPAGGIPSSWASLDVASPAGYRTQHVVVAGPGGYVSSFAQASNPGVASNFVRNAFRYNP
jgi:hypothetical protein